MKHLGDFDLSTALHFKFTTYRPSTGAPFTLAGTPTIAVYKDASTTESTAGVTLTVDFDARTGLNHVAITLATDTTFYSAGSQFEVVLTAGTVDGVSVAGSVVASFSIRKDSALKPTTAGRTLNAGTTGGVPVDSLAANALTAAATAPDFGTEVATAVWDRVLTTHNTANSAGLRMKEIATSVITSGTAQAGSTASTIVLATGALAVDGSYDPGFVRITSGTGVGQMRLITQYVGSTRTASVDRDWKITPDATSTYEVISTANIFSTNEGLAQGATSTSITLNALASTVDGTYNGQAVAIRTGTGQDQVRVITGYVGSTRVATVAPAWATTPAAGSGYMVLPHGAARITSVEAGGLAALQAGLATSVEVAALSTAIDALPTNAELATALASSDDAVLAILGTPAGASLAADIAAISVGSGGLDAAGMRAALGMASANLDTQLGALQSDTNDIQTRLPAALVSGRMDASVGAMAANVITAAAAAADFVTEVQTGLATSTQVAAADDALLAIIGTPANGTVSADIAAVDGGGGGGGLDAAGMRAAIGLASANLDTQLAALQADTNDIQTRLPAALVGGRMDSSVGAMAANVLTAAATAADYITEVQSGLATATAVDDLPTNAELATALASSDDAVMARLGTPATASIAGDIAAIGVAVGDLPTNTELATALAGADDAVLTAIAGVQSDTNDIQTRLPAALVSGRMDVSVGAMAADVLTAAATAADYITEVQNGLATAAALATVDTVVDSILVDTAAIDGRLPADPADASDIASATTGIVGLIGAPAGASIAADLAAVKAETAAILDDTGTAGVVVATASKTGYELSAAGVDAIHDEVVDGALTARQSIRLANAALGGKASGLETTSATFRNPGDTVDRIVATVDENGNRTAVTLNVAS